MEKKLTTLEKITIQEKEDRYVATKCLEELLKKGKDLTVTATDILDPVDLNCSVINQNDRLVKFNCEVKERYKDERKLKMYPNAELRVDKYNRMREATPEGKKLLYMVLLNKEKCLLFDLDKIDWSKIEKVDWKIEVTHMNSNTKWTVHPTYLIPYDMAVATTDCSDYFNEYQTSITTDKTFKYE